MWEKCINFLLISQCILLNKTKFNQLWYLLKKIMCTSSQVRHHQKKAIRQPPTTFLRKAIAWWICYISGPDFLLAIIQVLICQHIKNSFFFFSRNDISKSNSHRTGIQSHMSINLFTVRNVNCHNDHALMSPGSVLLFQ